MCALFLGREADESPYLLDPEDLRTHAVVVGMTGSGKTGFCLVMLEELVASGVPVIAIDPKGDLGNLGLVFPQLAASDFAPWCGDDDPDTLSARWRDGLQKWGLGTPELTRLKDQLDLRVYTPGSRSGIPVDLIGSLGRPDDAVVADDEARLALVSDTVGGLLALVGLTADPVRDPEHVVLSRIVDDAWVAGENLDLEALILRLVDPPFKKVGVFPLDRFFKPDDRMDLAMALNGVIASPAFEAWTAGVPLDVHSMLANNERTGVHVFSLAHLDDNQRQFFLSILFGRVLAWSRAQPGTDDLRAVLFVDEVAGYLPPHPARPPSKAPLLTMMKQARAVGLGVALATQNPVDLDYKALSNAGLWAVGRLGTAQDRARLLTGLKRPDLDEAVAGLAKRRFAVIRSGKEPSYVDTRHAMCFLRGPLTRVEFGKLAALSPEADAPGMVIAPAGRTPQTAPAVPEPEIESTGDMLSAPPPITSEQLFLDPRVAFSARFDGAFDSVSEPARSDGRVVHRPALMAEVSLRFDEERAGFILDESILRVWFPCEATGRPQAAMSVPIEAGDILSDPPDGALFQRLPDWMDEDRELKALHKEVVDDVYRAETRGMYVHKGLKLHGRAEESLEDFVERVNLAIEERIDAGVAKLKDRFETSAARIADKLEDKRMRLSEYEGVLQSQRMAEAVNVGETIWSFFGGRKKSMSTAMSRRKQTAQAGDRVTRTQAEIARLEEDAVDLALELEQATDAIRDTEEQRVKEVEEKQVRLEKNDVQLKRFAVLWIPVSRRI